MRRALVLVSLLLLAGCRRDTGAVCTGYDPVRGNCYDTSLDLDDARVMALDGAALPAGPGACRAPVLVRVTNVRDGDTLDVIGVSDPSFMGGVRLIGVDAPEIAHPPEPADCFGNEAQVFTQQLDERFQVLRDKFQEVSVVFALADWEQELFEDILRPELVA